MTLADLLDLALLGPCSRHHEAAAAPGGWPRLSVHPEIEATRVTQRPALLGLAPGRGRGGGAVGAARDCHRGG